MAAEYIVKEGNRDVILCERGIRTFETATRNTLDITAVPVIKTPATCRWWSTRATPPAGATWCCRCRGPAWPPAPTG